MNFPISCIFQFITWIHVHMTYQIITIGYCTSEMFFHYISLFPYNIQKWLIISTIYTPIPLRFLSSCMEKNFFRFIFFLFCKRLHELNSWIWKFNYKTQKMQKATTIWLRKYFLCRITSLFMIRIFFPFSPSFFCLFCPHGKNIMLALVFLMKLVEVEIIFFLCDL